EAGLGAAVAVGEGGEVEVADARVGGRLIEVVDRHEGAGEGAEVGAAVGAEGEGLGVRVGDAVDRDVELGERGVGLAVEDLEGVDAVAADRDQRAGAPGQRGVRGGGGDVGGGRAGVEVDDVHAAGRIDQVGGDHGETSGGGGAERAGGVEREQGLAAGGRIG